jgi:hypothetical protein
MEILLQLIVAVAMGLFVGELFCCVEETKQERRERRRVERWVADRVNRS